MAPRTVERQAAVIAGAAARAIGPALLAGAALGLAACGSGAAGPTSAPNVSELPLVPGARVLAQERVCDRGANAYCALELVVSASGYPNARALVDAQHRRLARSGWTGADADTGDERAADSPGHRLRVTYATAYGDLKGADWRWIQRSRPIQLALSRAVWRDAAAMSVLLERGSG